MSFSSDLLDSISSHITETHIATSSSYDNLFIHLLSNAFFYLLCKDFNSSEFVLLLDCFHRFIS